MEVKKESVSGDTHTVREEEFGEMNQEIIIFYPCYKIYGDIFKSFNNDNF